MSRLIGVALLVAVLYASLLGINENSRTGAAHVVLAGRVSFFGVLTLGVAMLIVSGGIDLSIGSVVGLSAVTFAVLLQQGWHPVLAIAFILSGSVVIGLTHGLLVTRLGLQPFLVTLCGLFAYRGLARQMAGGRDVGLGDAAESVKPTVLWLKQMLFETGPLGVSGQVLLFMALAGIFAVILHYSVIGRYLFAIGHNEQAAKYAGIRTDRFKIFAYVWCSVLAGGLGGMLELLDVGTASPRTAGQLYELYAITGAVLGGCSLHGGEGNVIGVILGTAVLPLLKNLIIMGGFADNLEYTIIGVALLLGTIVDELLRRGAITQFWRRLRGQDLPPNRPAASV